MGGGTTLTFWFFLKGLPSSHSTVSSTEVQAPLCGGKEHKKGLRTPPAPKTLELCPPPGDARTAPYTGRTEEKSRLGGTVTLSWASWASSPLESVLGTLVMFTPRWSLRRSRLYCSTCVLFSLRTPDPLGTHGGHRPPPKQPRWDGEPGTGQDGDVATKKGLGAGRIGAGTPGAHLGRD